MFGDKFISIICWFMSIFISFSVEINFDFSIVQVNLMRVKKFMKALLLRTQIFHNGTILSTLNISSRDFFLGFTKKSRTNGDSIP